MTGRREPDYSEGQRSLLRRMEDARNADFDRRLSVLERTQISQVALIQDLGFDRMSPEERETVVPMVKAWMFAKETAERRQEESGRRNNNLIVWTAVATVILMIMIPIGNAIMMHIWPIKP